MKKFYFLFFIAAFFSSALQAQTLFTYGGSAVDKQEFLRAYNKNKNPVTDKEKSLREYLDLYIKFKLKVKAAREQKLDTLPQLVSDLEAFRSQIAETYMNNENEVNRLVNEAFDRSQKDLHVFHFFAAVDNNMIPADTLKAFQAMQHAEEEFRKGNRDIERAANSLSAAYVPVKASDMGYITGFSLPYEIENLLYGLKTGEVSKPYRTAKGWHAFILSGERKSPGKWRVAQILLAFTPGSTDNNAVKKKADSIHSLLLKGADFAEMAKSVSDDKMTYMTGGEMPEFGTGRYDPSFENEVFKLNKDGEIGQPFATAFGFHIIKRIKQTPTPADRNDPDFRSDLKQKVLQDSRVNIARDIFLKDITQQVGLKKLNGVKEADLYRYADSVSANPDAPISKKISIYDKPLFTIGKKSYNGNGWLSFVRDYKSAPGIYKGESYPVLFDKYINTSILDYYRRNLESFNPDFHYQIEEFRDGNVLFEIMERNVWSPAGNDSAGLAKLYNEKKAQYQWGPSASIIVFNCTSKALADEAIVSIKNGKDWKKIVEENNNLIQADSGRYEISQIPMEQNIVPAEGLITKPVVNTLDGSSSFIKFIKLFPAGEQRNFEEARGLLINDYQAVMEERWVNSLKKKYPVKVNEEVFRSLIR